MNREQAIKNVINKKGNRLIAEFVFDVCVDKFERMETKEIIDRLDSIGVKSNVSTINKIIKKYTLMGFDVGGLPGREVSFFGKFNWNPEPISKNEFKHLKGAW